MDRTLRDVVVRPVRSREELERALMLVHDSYVRCGYMQPHPSGLRISPFFALKTTRTFVALLADEVVATVSLFGDSAMLLPADAIFAPELAALRARGGRTAEVGMLADRRKAMGRSMVAVLQMMKQVFWTALADRIDDLVITVNPKHAAFYRRLLCFELVAPARGYPAVGNAPAELLKVNFPSLQPQRAEDPKIRAMFLTPLRPEEQLAPYRMTPEDLAYFFVYRTGLLWHLNRRQVEAIEQHHPGLKIAGLLHAAEPPRPRAVWPAPALQAAER